VTGSTTAVGHRAGRVWASSLAGAALLLVGLDVLTRRRLGDALRAVLFRPDDTQVFEPRDMVWAAAAAVVGAALVAWGLRELFVPRPVIRADASGLTLAVSGPFRPPVTVPWEEVDDVGVAAVADDDETVDVFWVRVVDPGRLPADPWGARWVDERTVAVFTDGWERPPGEVAAAVVDVAVAVADDGP